MAEHDEKNFEQEIAKMLRELDSKIEIPEIPDAQSIFEKAEKEKQNVIPFKKYSRYIAAAAAVVLICISIPIISGIAAESLPQEAAEEKNEFSFVTKDIAVEEAETAVEPETPMEPEAAAPEVYDEPLEDEEDGSDNQNIEISDSTNSAAEYRVKDALMSFFYDNALPAKDPLKEQSSSASSSSMEQKPSVGNEAFVPEEGEIEAENSDFIREKINKKRAVEISVEKDSVSVRLFDTSAGNEIISAFWVEGTYESSYSDGDYYVINLIRKVDVEDIENDSYLPMAGDAEKGNYVISEESIFVSEKITKGVISLSVEINPGTGEYQIFASLV